MFRDIRRNKNKIADKNIKTCLKMQELESLL